MDDSALRRVVFYDADYPSGWVHSPELIAGLLAQRHGFVVMDAERLGEWMRAQVQSGAAPSGVCALVMGFAPDTVYERASAACTARRYLDAGGRLAWIGDVPFYQQGRAGRRMKDYGDAGHKAVLGADHVWGGAPPVELTPEGRSWGLVLADDEVSRCAAAAQVTALRRAGGHATTWHKAFHPAHPLQGFLRYAGGAFSHVHWNAKCNEFCRLALRGLEEPFRAPEGWRDPSFDAVDRAVFSDARYPSSWSPDAQASAERLRAAHGFAALDADALARWMRAKVAAGGAGSVCVILHGVAPDTVFERITPQCLIRRYLDSGGRVAWAGDLPFYCQGRRDGQKSFRDDPGTHECVLDIPMRGDWEVGYPPEITEAGKAWGLMTPDVAVRCVDASAVTEVLSGAGPFAASWLKTYAPEVPGSGFLRFRGGAFGGPAQADELAAVALHALPPKAAAPGEAPRPAAEGVLAAAGAFKVDRTRALDKLMRFMLPSAELFILPLARAAAAAGASRLSIAEDGADLVVDFDAALPEAVFRDPFAAVLEESQGHAPARSAGLAVLTALRAEPEAVCLSASGPPFWGGVRAVSPLEFAPWSGERPGLEGTRLRLMRPKRLDAGRLRVLLAERAPGLPFALQGAGAPEPSGPYERAISAGPLRGRLRVPSEPSPASALDVCVHGVLAGPASLVLPEAQVEGWVNDDRLALNASQGGVVRDERWEALASAVGVEARSLALQAVEALGASLGAREKLLAQPGPREVWRRSVTGAAGGLFARVLSSAVDDGEEKTLAASGRAARWLREAARRSLANLEGDAHDPLRRALWSAPLYLTVDGEGVSLETLELRRRADGAVRTAREYAPGRPLSAPVVWLEGDSESELLRRLFGDALRPADQELASLETGRAATEGAQGGLLARAGAGALLARLGFEAGERSGELGLRLEAPAGARLYGLKEGRPGAFRAVPGVLRWDAALEGAVDDAALAGAQARSEALYRLLANGLCCPVAFGFAGRLKTAWKNRARPLVTARERAALEHLRDYLERFPDRAWARTAPLFETMAGWRSLEDLEEALAAERVLAVALNAGSSGWPGTMVLGGAPMSGRLRRLLPRLDSVRLSRWDRELLFESPPKPSCAHGASFGCLVEGALGGGRVHLAVGRDGGLLSYPAEGGSAVPANLAAAGTLGAEAALAVLRRAPAAVAPGDHPWRRFVLAAARAYLAPWPGPAAYAPLRAMLEAAQLLRGPNGSKALLDLSSWGGPVHYARPGQAKTHVSLILDEEELATLRALWPEQSRLLMTVDEHETLGKRMPEGMKWAKAEILKARAPAKARAAVKRAPSDAVGGAKELLADLAAANGLALFWRDAKEMKAEGRTGKTLISHPNPGGWTLHAAHPLAKPVLCSELPPEVQAAYLASAIHSAANQMMSRVTDSDDARFQEALALRCAAELLEEP